MKPHIVAFIVLITGCSDNQVVVPPLAREPFEFRAHSYSTSYYFVDTLYRHFYEPYYTNSPPIVNPPTRIVDAEVWVQRVGFMPDPRECRAIACITLSRRDTGYSPSLRNTPADPGRVISAPFIRLAPADYELTANGYLGVIRLNTSTTISSNPISDEQTVAIAYRCADGSQYGEFMRDIPFDTLLAGRRLILKIVKPDHLQFYGPVFQVAWLQMLKNIYSIGFPNVQGIGFELDIFRMIPGQVDQNVILNRRLLRVLGLDRYNSSGIPSVQGDGAFDYRPGVTIDQLRGDIIFPSLRPFDDGIKKYFQSVGVSLDTSYLDPAIYDTTMYWAQRSIFDRYIVRGRAHWGYW